MTLKTFTVETIRSILTPETRAIIAGQFANESNIFLIEHWAKPLGSLGVERLRFVITV